MTAVLRNPAAAAGLAMAALLLIAALLAPLIAPYDPLAQDVTIRLMPPSAAHWLGTDGLGRDILSRIVYGARPTLVLVLLVVGITVPIGLTMGILSGFLGGAVDAVLMKVTDVVMAFPRLVLAMAFVASIGRGLFVAALALALTTWPAYARQSRAETRLLRRAPHIEAAEMLGIRGARLLVGHVLPLCMPTTSVRMALDFGAMILAAAGLGFLGLGVQPPTAEWGQMVAEGSKVILDDPWVATAPGVAILAMSLGFNLLADGLRDVLDPRRG